MGKSGIRLTGDHMISIVTSPDKKKGPLSGRWKQRFLVSHVIAGPPIGFIDSSSSIAGHDSVAALGAAKCTLWPFFVWKSPSLNGKTHHKWPCSTAMLNYHGSTNGISTTLKKKSSKWHEAFAGIWMNIPQSCWKSHPQDEEYFWMRLHMFNGNFRILR